MWSSGVRLHMDMTKTAIMIAVTAFMAWQG